MNKVSFSPEVFLKSSLQFFLELSMVLGAIYYDRAGFFEKKKFFAPKNGENRPSLGFFECIRKFRYYVFLSLVYNGSLY